MDPMNPTRTAPASQAGQPPDPNDNRHHTRRHRPGRSSAYGCSVAVAHLSRPAVLKRAALTRQTRARGAAAHLPRPAIVKHVRWRCVRDHPAASEQSSNTYSFQPAAASILTLRSARRWAPTVRRWPGAGSDASDCGFHTTRNQDCLHVSVGAACRQAPIRASHRHRQVVHPPTRWLTQRTLPGRHGTEEQSATSPLTSFTAPDASSSRHLPRRWAGRPQPPPGRTPMVFPAGSSEPPGELLPRLRRWPSR